MNTQEARNELRKLMDSFILTSRSHEIRVELSDLIVEMYSIGDLSREEYHDLMAQLA